MKSIKANFFKISNKGFGDGIIYAFGVILSKALPFVLLPIYTRIFTVAEYGRIEFLLLCTAGLSVILNAGMDAVQSVYFHNTKKRRQEKTSLLIGNILQIRIIWSFIVLAVLSILIPVISSIFDKSELDINEFMLIFMNAFLVQIMSQAVEIFRLTYKPWTYVVITLLYSLLSASSSIVLVLIYKLNIIGYLLGVSFSALTATILAMYLIRSHVILVPIRKKIAYLLLSVGLPLIPSEIALYILTSQDRWFLKYFYGDEEFGLYSVGAKYALIISVFVEAFRKTWWPIAVRLMYEENSKKVIKKVFNLYVYLGSIMVILISYISQFIIKLMVPDIYINSSKIVGILALIQIYFGLYLIVSIGIWRAKKTGINFIIAGVCVVIGSSISLILVPNFGYYGAALSSVLGFSAWIIITLKISEKNWTIDFDTTVLYSNLLIVSTYLYINILITTNLGIITAFFIAILSSWNYFYLKKYEI